MVGDSVSDVSAMLVSDARDVSCAKASGVAKDDIGRLWSLTLSCTGVWLAGEPRAFSVGSDDRECLFDGNGKVLR